MHFYCKNRCVLQDFHFGILVAVAYHLSTQVLKKHFKMGVQDVPEPFQNAVSFELVKQSAFMIDFRRILGANWEGFGGLRLRHEPSSLS